MWCFGTCPFLHYLFCMVPTCFLGNQAPGVKINVLAIQQMSSSANCWQRDMLERSRRSTAVSRFKRWDILRVQGTFKVEDYTNKFSHNIAGSHVQARNACLGYPWFISMGLHQHREDTSVRTNSSGCLSTACFSQPSAIFASLSLINAEHRPLTMLDTLLWALNPICFFILAATKHCHMKHHGTCCLL